MSFQLPGPQFYEQGASQYPGLNTAAGAYQQAQTTLGPSLLSYLVSAQNHADTLAFQRQQLESLDSYRKDQMANKEATLGLAEQQKTNNLINAMGTVQGQLGQREQGRALGINTLLTKPETANQIKASIPHQTLLPWDWGKPKLTDQAIVAEAAKRYDAANPGIGMQGLQNTASQLQQLINQRLGAGLTQQPTPQGTVFTTASGRQYTRDAQGNPIFLT